MGPHRRKAWTVSTTQHTSATDAAQGAGATEFFNSLTGFEEIAVKRAFGVPISTLSGNKKAAGEPLQFLRALVFAGERRQGRTDAEAFEAAQAMPLSDVMGYFPDPAPELDPDHPETEAGKEPSATDTTPSN